MLRFTSLALALLFTVPVIASDRPNVLLVMADDLGFSDLGCYGGEIQTPVLDGLAKNGLRFAQFYNTARCWPTRAALLTGFYAQEVRRDRINGSKLGQRPKWAKLLPAYLQSNGYRTYHSGKWHLDGDALPNGFDKSYRLKDQGRFFSPRVHYENDKRLPAIKRGTGFYGTTAIADHAIRCLKEHAESSPSTPFFHYLAFTAPHFPLHALPEDIEKYRETYRKGWEEIRAQRWARIQKLGFIPGTLSPVERDIGPPYPFPKAIKTLGPGEVNRPLPWNSLTAEQREFQATKMAIHAAMVDRLDRELGRVVDQLRDMKALENTVIFFLSDNGASAEIMVRDDGHDPSAAPGSASTYLCLGPGWSNACNTPFRRHKTWVHEGGAATPLIVHWPNGIAARGEWRQQVGHVVDVVPTVLELAQISAASVQTGPPFAGQSFLSALREDKPQDARELWWNHKNNRAFRVGHWKLVAAAHHPWELYDLAADRTETQNLSGRYPEKVRELQSRWKAYVDRFERQLKETQSSPKQ